VSNLAIKDDLSHGTLVALRVREFDVRRVRHDLQASLRIACWAYGQLAARSGQVWIRGRLLEPLQESWVELVCG